MPYLKYLAHVMGIVWMLGLTMPVYADSALIMAEGVVRKLDPENRKITLKHGEIKNLEMPAMTMVFRLPENFNFDSLKLGDKVRFHVEKTEAGYTITDIQLAP